MKYPIYCIGNTVVSQAAAPPRSLTFRPQVDRFFRRGLGSGMDQADLPSARTRSVRPMKPRIFLIAVVSFSPDDRGRDRPLPTNPDERPGFSRSPRRASRTRSGADGRETIGCTYGGRSEFRFQGTFIQDYQPLPWSEEAVAAAFRDSPGLYDDVYMDLTFVEVFAKEGLDAPAASFARAFARRRLLPALARQSDGPLQHPPRDHAPGLGRLEEQSSRRRHRLPDRSRFRRTHVSGSTPGGPRSPTASATS